jgi:hypothetical protein
MQDILKKACPRFELGYAHKEICLCTTYRVSSAKNISRIVMKYQGDKYVKSFRAGTSC